MHQAESAPSSRRHRPVRLKHHAQLATASGALCCARAAFRRRCRECHPQNRPPQKAGARVSHLEVPERQSGRSGPPSPEHPASPPATTTKSFSSPITRCYPPVGGSGRKCCATPTIQAPKPSCAPNCRSSSRRREKPQPRPWAQWCLRTSSTTRFPPTSSTPANWSANTTRSSANSATAPRTASSVPACAP